MRLMKEVAQQLEICAWYGRQHGMIRNIRGGLWMISRYHPDAKSHALVPNPLLTLSTSAFPDFLLSLPTTESQDGSGSAEPPTLQHF